MNRRLLALCALALSTGALAADTPAVSGGINGIEIGRPGAVPRSEQQAPPRTGCLSQCDAAEARCGSEVRRARQQCSKTAANGGREPLGRNYDLAYFCAYFDQPGRRCGPGAYGRDCQARFAHRYGLCVETLNNVAAMRYDCYRSERDAQNFCREELRDCKAACPLQ